MIPRSRPTRRWQFSLRTLLIVPVVVALLLGVAFSRVVNNRRQARRFTHCGHWVS